MNQKLLEFKWGHQIDKRNGRSAWEHCTIPRSNSNQEGMISTGKYLRTRRKICPSVTSSKTNSIWTDLGANPDLRGERPAGLDDARPSIWLVTEYMEWYS
jgi:hypothetical protein